MIKGESEGGKRRGEKDIFTVTNM
jgi:hypothetical protein